MKETHPELKRLCIHSITTKPWRISEAVSEYARAGVGGITVWRDAFSELSPAELRRYATDAGLSVVSLCRGGFFAAAETARRRRAIEDNLRAIDEAAALGAPHIVMVCGADPEIPLSESRMHIVEGFQAISDHAAKSGVKLAVEPLHPMYADTRSAINTLGQANDMCDIINEPHIGVAVDVYHLWWDPELESEIARTAQADRLFAFHVCDWRSPTRDMLNDRGLPGDGCIRIPTIREWVERTGFNGFIEVEVFSTEYWSMDQHEFLERIVASYNEHV